MARSWRREVREAGRRRSSLFFVIFNWVSSVCTFNITLRGPERKARESWHLLLSQGLKSRLMALFWVLSEVVGLLRRLDPIPYLVKRQDAAVTRTTFYRVAGLKSLANHWLRSYHTHKVWCGGADEGLIECGKTQEWFTDYFDSELVTVCKGGHLRDTMQGESRSSLLSFRTILS